MRRGKFEALQYYMGAALILHILVALSIQWFIDCRSWFTCVPERNISKAMLVKVSSLFRRLRQFSTD